jgi:hypothetical protein
VLLLLIAAGLALRIRNATADIFELFSTTLFDDTFYYLGIAHHIALGNPPSIDGLTATNGFHPLWMLLLLPGFLLSAPDDLLTPLRVALGLGALFDMVSSLLIWRITGRMGLRQGPRLIGTAMFLLNPFQAANATNGMETSMALCLLLALTAHEMGTRSAARLSDIGEIGGFGLLAGLVILARTDYLIVVACLYASRLIWAYRVRPTLLVRWLAGPSLCIGGLLAPWLVYSWLTTGQLMQSSAFALTTVYALTPEAMGMTPSVAVRLGQGLGTTAHALSIIGDFLGLRPTERLVLWSMPLLFLATPWRRRLLSRVAPLAPLLLGLVLLFVAHTFVRLTFTGWYNVPYVGATALLAAALLDAIAERTRAARAALALGTALLAAFLFNAHDHWLEAVARRETHRHLPVPDPSSRRHGSTDCGRVSYFQVRGVTNLDGMINPRAHRAIAQSRLLDYVREEGLLDVYAADYYHSPVYFGRRYREQVIPIGDDFALVRIASAQEKNATIALAGSEVQLGSRRGRSYLGDGWDWSLEEQVSVLSVGTVSELLFFLPDWAGLPRALELRLAAEQTDQAGTQPVHLLVNAVPAGLLRVRRAAAWYRVASPAFRSGRNRLTLVYGAPRRHRAGFLEDFGMSPVRAVHVEALRDVRDPLRTIDVPLAGDKEIDCRGLGPLGYHEGAPQRWIEGRGSVTFPTSAFPDLRGCCVELGIDGGRWAAVSASWNGTPMVRDGSCFLVPSTSSAARPAQELVVEVSPPASADETPAEDARGRTLPMRYLRVRCAPAGRAPGTAT